MKTSFQSRRSIRRHLVASVLIACALVAGFGGWALNAELAGAVVATGVVVVESEVKQVQHPTGGVVSELNVHNDDYVNAGDVVVRLDATQTKANLAVFSKSLDELRARQARLEAEKNSAGSIDFPDELLPGKRAIPRWRISWRASASSSPLGSRRGEGRGPNCMSELLSSVRK